MTCLNVTLHRIKVERLIKQDKTRLFSDVELLSQLCSLDEDQEVYDEFVRRFYKDLEEECKRRCKARKLDKHIGIQVAHDTLEKVRRHKTFRADEMNYKDSRKGILVYLFRISINLFNDHHRKEKKQNDQIPHKMYLEELIGEISLKKDPALLKRTKELTLQVFKLLNPKEQKVILVDIEYKKHNKYLPDDVNERLSVELGVKKDSIRKIRERAVQKIKKAIDEINQA